LSEPVRPAGDTPAPGPRVPAEDARSSRRGEFDRVLERRQPAPEPGRARREGEAPAPGAPGVVAGREGRRGEGEGGGDGAGGEPGGGREQRTEWRALPGDLALPVGLPPGPAAPGPAAGVRAADLAATVEQIAGRIVQAAELRLGPTGGAEARFSLDLATLGPAGLHLTRGADGSIAVRFDVQTAELARVLRDALPELVARLEARGLAVREVAVRDPEGATVRVAPGSDAAAAEEARRQAEEEGRRHRPPPPEPPPEEE
jgi:hypothetical protein